MNSSFQLFRLCSCEQMNEHQAELLNSYARNAGYASYEDVPLSVLNLPYDHVGSIFQPFPVRITSREFYTPYPELFEARWGAPLPPDSLAEYQARRETNNAEAAARAAAAGVLVASTGRSVLTG